MKRLVIKLTFAAVSVLILLLLLMPVQISACILTQLRVEAGDCSGTSTKIFASADAMKGNSYLIEVTRFEGSAENTMYTWTGGIDSNTWSTMVSAELPAGDYVAYFLAGSCCDETIYFKIEKCPKKVDYSPGGFINDFFENILKRSSTSSERQLWMGNYSNGWTAGDIITDFIMGTEAQAVLAGYTDEEFLDYLYWVLFSRTPDAEGEAAWLARIEAGMTRNDVVTGFTDSEEFKALCGKFNIIP